MNWVSPGVERTLLTTYTATYSSLTNATAVNKWYRDGQFYVGSGQVIWTGNGGAGTFTCSITGTGAPAGILIDTTALVGGSSTANAGSTDVSAGHSFWFDSGAGWADIYPVFNTTTTIAFFMNSQKLDGNQFANGDALNFSFRVPIVGWT